MIPGSPGSSNLRRYGRRPPRLFIRSPFIYPGPRCARTPPPPAPSRRSASATAPWCWPRCGAAAASPGPSWRAVRGCRARPSPRSSPTWSGPESPPSRATSGPAAAGFVVADLGHTVLAEEEVALAEPFTVAGLVDALAPAVLAAVARAGVPAGRLIGAGVAIPAPVDRGSGRIGESSTIPELAGSELGQALAER